MVCAETGRKKAIMKLFRKDIDPRCAYCDSRVQDTAREVLCVKRGIVPMESHSGQFRYDPLRRTPPRPVMLRTANLDEKDFSL